MYELHNKLPDYLKTLRIKTQWRLANDYWKPAAKRSRYWGRFVAI